MDNKHPLSPSAILAGLIVAVVGGIIVAYITKQGKYSSATYDQVKKDSTSFRISDNSNEKKAQLKTAKTLSSRAPLCATKESFIYDSISLETHTYRDGLVEVINKSNIKQVWVHFYSEPYNGSIYVIPLDNSTSNALRIPGGKYFWQVQSKEGCFNGGELVADTKVFKSITLQSQ